MQQMLQTAVEHHQAGRLQEAEILYRKILEVEPRDANALHLLGVIAHEKGMNETAVELIERAHRYQRPHLISLNNLGKAYFALGRLREAKKCFSKALVLKPDDAETHHNFGAVLSKLGQASEAIASYRRAIALDPGNPGAHYSLGRELENVGRLDEAAQSFSRALSAQPDVAEVHVSLGNVLQDLGRLEEAEGNYRAALAVKPDLALAHNNLGGLLQQCRRLEEAEQSFRKAVALIPGAAYAHCNLGNVLCDLGRLDDAAQSYRQALALEPDYAEARWALTIAKLPSLDGAQQADEGASAALREIIQLGEWLEENCSADRYKAVGSLQPFYLAYQEENHRDLLAEYGKLCSKLMQGWKDQQRFRPFTRAHGDKIRVGIVSAHIHDHSVWNAIAKGWLQHMDRNRFEISVFHVGAIHDQETQLAKSQAAHFEHAPKTLREWVGAISAQQCDALIYPEIGMDATTLRLAALRLAPVQLAAWGHPETTGLPTMDYFLSAQMLEPEEAEKHYTEQLVALPNLGVCYEPLHVTSIDPDLAYLGIRPDSPLLVCPGVPFKYAPCYDRLFTEIAGRLGQCQFVFFMLKSNSLSEKFQQRLRDEFACAKMDFDQHCIFIPRQPPAIFYGLMKRADVFLDTIGFSGFNTAMQAVDCGLPIVTKEGHYMRGRFAAGILRRIGVPELIVNSEDNYVALAIRLVQDADLRQEIRARMEASRGVLHGDLAPVRGLEDFLVKVTRPH